MTDKPNTRYYAPTCFANAEERVVGWHNSLQWTLWCHAINNTKVHPLDAICAKDTGKKKRLLNEDECKEIIEITAASPWKLTPWQKRDVIKRTKKPPWALGVGGPVGGPIALGCVQCCSSVRQ